MQESVERDWPLGRVTSTTGSSTDRLFRFAMLPLLLILWIAMHPYRGIYHDTRVYTLLALDRLDPGVFNRDLFLLFGSQDAYTVFTPIYAGAIKLFGLLEANIVLLLTGQAIWLLSAYFFVRRLGRGMVAYVMLAAIIVMPGYYGGLGVFSYFESFLTPRPFAEALVLLGLVALLRRRLRLTFLLLAVALVIHPLIAVSGIATVGLMLILQDRRWIAVAAACVLLVLIAATLGIRPFDLLFHAMDADWLDLVRRRNVLLLLTQWSVEDWGALAADFSLVAAGAMMLTGNRRRLMLAILIAGIGGVVISLIGGDLLKSTLMIQLQLWRATWLLHLASYPAAILLFLRLRHWPDGLAILSLLLTGWALSAIPIAGPFISATALLLIFARSHGGAGPLPRRTRLALYGIAVTVGLAWLGLWCWSVFRLWQAAGKFGLEFVPRARYSRAFALAIATISCFVIGALKRRRPLVPLILLTLAAPLSVMSWNEHLYWDELMGLDSGSSLPSFRTAIGENASVFWPEHPSAVWILLHRPSYVSLSQAVGIVFSADTAREWARRTLAVEPLQTSERIDALYEMSRCDEVGHEPTAIELGALCQAESQLNFIVLPQNFPALSKATWHAPKERAKLCTKGGEITVYRRDRDFYLYDCAEISRSRQ